MSDQISMRVNAGRLASLTGNTVRLPCKVLRVSSSTSATQSTSDHPSLIQLSDDTAIVEASDGGQVEIQRKNIEVTGTYIEVVGTVVNASSIKALAAIPLDSDGELDMKLINDVIELTFESRFDKIFPRYPTHV